MIVNFRDRDLSILIAHKCILSYPGLMMMMMMMGGGVGFCSGAREHAEDIQNPCPLSR